MVDFARVLQVLSSLSDDRQQRLLIGLVPGEGLQEERDATLIGRYPEDELLEIPSAVFGAAVRDGHIAEVEVGVILAADAEGGGVDVEAVRTVIAGEQARRDDLEMTDRDVESFDEVSRGGHSRGFS